MISSPLLFFFFFFNDTATTEIYTLSLHYALPISQQKAHGRADHQHHEAAQGARVVVLFVIEIEKRRSEEHTSELQSPCNLVCRLLLEKKKEHSINCHVSERWTTYKDARHDHAQLS